jgi:hypothetical protein
VVEGEEVQPKFDQWDLAPQTTQATGGAPPTGCFDRRIGLEGIGGRRPLGGASERHQWRYIFGLTSEHWGGRASGQQDWGERESYRETSAPLYRFRPRKTEDQG